MALLRSIARALLPRQLRAYLRRHIGLASSTGIEYRGSYPTWDAARRASGGYEAEAILAKSLEAALKVKRGEAAYERDSVTFVELEERYPLLAALLYAASPDGKLTVLDFGGGLGSTYFQHRRRLRSLRTFRWHIVEQAGFVEKGSAHLADEHLRFFRELDDAVARATPDVVLLSSVLPYVEAPLGLIERIATLGAPLVMIDRNIVLRDHPTRLTVQQVPAHIYRASYPCWILNERVLLEQFDPHYELLDEFPAYEGTVVDLGDARAEYKGYTLRRKAH